MASAQKDMLEERMKVCNMLWQKGIKVHECEWLFQYYSPPLPFDLQAELSYKKNPKFLNQIQYCEREKVPFMVVVGVEERDQGGVKIRDVVNQTEVRV